MKIINPFYRLCFGQTVSLLGSQATNFALGVWAYKISNSVVDFSLVILSITLAGALITPLAGSLIDKYNKKSIMLYCDIGQFITLAFLFFVIDSSTLNLFDIYIVCAVRSALGKVQRLTFDTIPACYTSEPHELKRYASIVQTGSSLSLFAPVLGGLFADNSPVLILLLDMITFVIALVILMLTKVKFIPQKSEIASKSLRGERLLAGFFYFKNNPNFLATLLWIAFITFVIASVSVLITPLILTAHDSKLLGYIYGTAAIAAILGSAISIRFSKRRGNYPTLSVVLAGLFIVGIALNDIYIWLVFMVFGFYFVSSQAAVALKAFWYIEVPKSIQGRVFSVRDLVIGLAAPIGYLVSPLVVEKNLEPWFESGDPLTSFFSGIIGYDANHGLLFLFIITGVAIIISVLIHHLYILRRKKNGTSC